MLMVLMEDLSFLVARSNFPSPIQKCATVCGEWPAWQKAILYIV